MPVDTTLAQYSDLAFRVSFAIYTLAVVLLIAHYAKIAPARAQQRATAVAAKSAATQTHAAGSVTVLERDADTPAEPPKPNFFDKAGGMGMALVYLGLVFHVISIVLRGLSAGRFPWGNLYEYVSVMGAGVILTAAVLLRTKARQPLMTWVMVPVLALLFFGGTKLYAESAPVVPALQSYWVPIHVSSVVGGASIVLFSGVASLAYLLRVAQPKGQEKGVLGLLAAPLPTADTLDRMAYRIMVVGFPIFGLGIIFGAIWAEAAWGRFWGWDPKETISLVTWVLYAAYLHARAPTGWRVAAAWINVAAFVAMIFNLFFINMVVSGLHSYAGLN